MKKLSVTLSKNQWMSTQSTAYALIAASKFVKANATSAEMHYTAKINTAAAVTTNTKVSLKQIDLGIKGAESGTLTVTNTGSGVMFARIILEGIPETGDQTAADNDLSLKIKYTTLQGEDLDVTQLEQGNDFIAEVEIMNPGTRGEYAQMALSQIFPSGWEIHNSRMDEAESTIKTSIPTYQDIRDDRVYTYFNIGSSEKKVFRIVLNAAYVGKYYLPTVTCEAMYDNTINSRKPGKWVEVVKVGSK
jgi:hypothetical protein